MAKDRSMATGPYPVRAGRVKVVLEGSWSGGGYRQRVSGYQARITLSDGTDVYCSHPHGHRKQSTLVACATALVQRLNDAAGIPRDAQ